MKLGNKGIFLLVSPLYFQPSILSRRPAITLSGTTGARSSTGHAAGPIGHLFGASTELPAHLQFRPAAEPATVRQPAADPQLAAHVSANVVLISAVRHSAHQLAGR